MKPRLPENSLTLMPIGTIRNGRIRKFDTPHQPDPTDQSQSIIELRSHFNFERALDDLEGFEKIWLLWWFDKNTSWKPKVLPPRGEGVKRGVFSTRSPHRPNPLGLSAVELLGISGRKLTIGPCDLLDGTPILDIKPYIPSIDSHPNSKVGWLRNVEKKFAEAASHKVAFKPKVIEQLRWLEKRGINFIDRAIAILERDPSPNKTRRIKKWNEELYRMGCAEWRIFFSVRGEKILLEHIQPGYSAKLLKKPGSTVIANRDAQLDFLKRWSLL